MKAILIDPFQETVDYIEADFDDFQEIQKAIDCNIFCLAGRFDGNVVFCDDEGWYREDKAFTKMPHYPQPLIGKLLVLGETPDGGSKDPTISPDELKSQDGFDFPSPMEVYLNATRGMYG